MIKAVFLDAYTLDPGDNSLQALHELIELKIYPRTSYEQIVDRCQNAEIVIVNKVKLDENIISQLPDLKFIQVAATGYNNIATSYAKNHGIKVCNVAGYSTSSVCQHVFAMLLNYLNNSQQYTTEVRDGKWSAQADFSYWHRPINELAGMKMGIIGYGQIGRTVASVASAFGMKVQILNYKNQTIEAPYMGVDLNTLLRESDVISLHAPLNEQTKYIIQASTLTLMKRNAILVNTSRGDLINEQDLAQALNDNIIQCALLDVLSVEPPPANHILRQARNCFITPHQAWASLQSRQRLVQLMVENIQVYLNGGTLKQVS